jgi:hypothetical protein
MGIAHNWHARCTDDDLMKALPSRSDLFDDMEPPQAVDHVNQAAVVDRDIVCAYAVATGLRVRFEMSDF